MAFSRKKYSGPMKNRGTVNGKADVSKEELDDFKAKYGADKTLRDLLNADRAGKKPDVSKNKASPAEYELIKPVDKSLKKFGEDGKLRSEKPAGMKKLPDNRPVPEGAKFGDPGAPKRKSPEMIKTSDKKDDTSLSVSERIKNARERARTSDTGTDKRSVSDRLKSALGMAAFGIAAGPGAAIARSAGKVDDKVAEEAKKEKGMKKGGSVKGYGKARGGRACKMR